MKFQSLITYNNKKADEIQSKINFLLGLLKSQLFRALKCFGKKESSQQISDTRIEW